MSNILSNINQQELIDRLQKHVCLVGMRVSYPKMNHQIAGAVVELGDTDGNLQVPAELCTVPQWKLIPREWARRFATFEATTRSILKSTSRIFHGARGTTLMPWTKAEQTFAALKQQRLILCGDPVAGIPGMVDEFIEYWPTHLQALRTQLAPEMFAHMIVRLPDVTQLRDKFGLRICTIPLAGTQRGVSPEKVSNWLLKLEEAGVDTRPELAAILEDMRDTANTAMSEMLAPSDMLGAQEMISEARRQLHDYIAEHLEALAREPRQQLADALDHVAEMCRGSDRHLRRTSLEKVQRAYEYLQGFAFLADDALLARMDQVSSAMTRVTAQQLNRDSDIAAQFAAVLSQASDECRSAAGAAAGLKRFASLDIGG